MAGCQNERNSKSKSIGDYLQDFSRHRTIDWGSSINSSSIPPIEIKPQQATAIARRRKRRSRFD
ncbi:hypothetical protein LguiB_007196 [Lonicera macranthoides]